MPEYVYAVAILLIVFFVLLEATIVLWFKSKTELEDHIMKNGLEFEKRLLELKGMLK